MANPLEQAFGLTHQKITENGDLSFDVASLSNNLVNILFFAEYLTHHLDQVSIGSSPTEQLFARMIRDPRAWFGFRDLGRELMHQASVSPEDIVKSGRFDDLMFASDKDAALEYWRKEIASGNQLAKKWAPRYSSKHLMQARELAKLWGFNKQQYGKFVKVDTTESYLSRKTTEKIIFEHVPSRAMLKYYSRFHKGADTAQRFAEYLADVKAGVKKLNVSTTTVYDIYKNRNKIDADLFFSKMEKIAINCIPVVDTSMSMYNDKDAIGKALSIGHYLSKCSTYCNNQFVTFSHKPELVTIHGKSYSDEFDNMRDANWGNNTNFGAVMNLLSRLESFPDYIVVLSDMEFDVGSRRSTLSFKDVVREHGAQTKLVWWNFNARNTTSPARADEDGNIFLSGYSPMLLKFLQVSFDQQKLLDTLLEEYLSMLEA